MEMKTYLGLMVCNAKAASQSQKPARAMREFTVKTVRGFTCVLTGVIWPARRKVSYVTGHGSIFGFLWLTLRYNLEGGGKKQESHQSLLSGWATGTG